MRTILILLVLTLLTACSSPGGASPAVEAVERYYAAIMAKDASRLSTTVCADFENIAQVELDSFQGVQTELQDFTCRETGKEGEFTLVKCDGKILATYGNEVMDFPLAERVHRVKNEGGDWRVCGY